MLPACCHAPDAVRAEAGALRGLKDQLRVCVATIGDGAAADAGLYSSLYGSIIIWLGEWQGCSLVVVVHQCTCQLWPPLPTDNVRDA